MKYMKSVLVQWEGSDNHKLNAIYHESESRLSEVSEIVGQKLNSSKNVGKGSAWNIMSIDNFKYVKK